MIDASSSPSRRIRIHVVERAEQLLLRVQVAGRAIAADAHADSARAAALALRVPHRVQNALANAVERAIGAAEMRKLNRQRVLRVCVFAAAAFENQLDFDLVAFPLVEVDDRGAGTEVVAGVLAGDRVDGIGPQLAAAGRFRHGFADLLRIQIWFAPTGTWTSKVGIPVSWQIAPSWSTARSMFCAMMASA